MNSHTARLGIAWLLSCALVQGAEPPRTARISNGPLTLHFVLADGRARVAAFENTQTHAKLGVQAELFRLYLPAGEVVGANEFLAAKMTSAPRRLEIQLVHAGRGIDARVLYEVKPGDRVIRKTVHLRATGRPFVLRDIDVECIDATMKTDLGGRGQPIYLAPVATARRPVRSGDRKGALGLNAAGGPNGPPDERQKEADGFFLGLEYPAGFNIVADGKVVLRHYPGKTIGKDGWTSKTAVLGAGGHDAFMQYVDTIRTRPRSYLLYNSWYDLRRREMTVERFAGTYEIMRKRLAPYGVTLAAFVPDDGWQNKQSIWEPDRTFLPQGYKPLADILEKGGTRLGLWMPLTGVNLDVSWGVKQGYEAGSKRHYCMAGPKYNKAIRAVLKDKILNWRVSYFKHDFNSFSCSKPGHGHLPEVRYGFEANVDAEIGLLQYERTLRPEIFLNVTSNMWLSPWWLMYADAIWMGCGDFGLIKTVPAIERREWAITYRDHHLWRRFRKERCQYPMTATMTHGVIYGKRNMLGGRNEPLDVWADNVVWYFLRGMQMKELYITPSILTDAQWDILGRACRWANDQAPVLRTAQLLGGDPAKGEVYGFASHADGVAFFGFRNPSIEPQSIEVAARDLVGDRPSKLKLIYPFKCDAGAVLPDGAVRQALGPNAIRIYRADADAAVKTTRLDPAAFGPAAAAVEIVAGTEAAAGLACTVKPRRSDLTALRLVLLLDKAYYVNAAKGIEIRANGERVKPSEVKLEGLRLLLGDLPKQGCTLRISASPAALDGPFRSNIMLSGWILADYPGAPGPAPASVAELASPYASRRRVAAPLGEKKEIDLSARRRISLTEADLKGIRAAMLHVLIFGANGEKQYANKPLLLNGEQVATVPHSGRPLDTWRRKLVPIPKDKLGLIKLDNEIRFGNRGGDCYKLRDVALAVQLKDGRWAETAFDRKVYCSVKGWLHSEGEAFKRGTSPGIRAAFAN